MTRLDFLRALPGLGLLAGLFARPAPALPRPRGFEVVQSDRWDVRLVPRPDTDHWAAHRELFRVQRENDKLVRPIAQYTEHADGRREWWERHEDGWHHVEVHYRRVGGADG